MVEVDGWVVRIPSYILTGLNIVLSCWGCLWSGIFIQQIGPCLVYVLCNPGAHYGELRLGASV